MPYIAYSRQESLLKVLGFAVRICFSSVSVREGAKRPTVAADWARTSRKRALRPQPEETGDVIIEVLKSVVRFQGQITSIAPPNFRELLLDKKGDPEKKHGATSNATVFHFSGCTETCLRWLWKVKVNVWPDVTWPLVQAMTEDNQYAISICNSPCISKNWTQCDSPHLPISALEKIMGQKGAQPYMSWTTLSESHVLPYTVHCTVQ